jgi:histidinol-phosphate aminotransferase
VTFAEIADSFFKPAVQDLVPYEPGKPVEEVQRELGLEWVIKLASNEGPFGPFPAALEAIEREARDLNRYPDGGAWRLRTALAELHDVRFEEIAPGAGSDGIVDYLSQIPLRDHRYDLDAMLEAIGPKTKLVYVCHPNNPTGTMNTRSELDMFLDQVPGHVLTVLDQAYYEYIDDPEYVDGLEYLKAGRKVAVLRTFSKIYGLAGLRVGYAVGPAELVTAIGKVRRAFDVNSFAQAAALASLDAPDELARRRAFNAEGLVQLERIMRDHGLEPSPSVANFLFAEVGEDSRPLFEQLLREGVIVRPAGGFGAPGAIRVTVGTAAENELFGEALGRVLSAATQT